jgi:3-oxoacyl-[acyl-carrier protein] reductase
MSNANLFNLKDQRVLVTGAGSGIGAAVAVALGAAGAAVGVHYNRNRTGADKVIRQIRDAGATAEAFGADLTDAQAVENLFKDFDNKMGNITGLVNNAGDWMDKSPIVDCTLAQWQHMFEVNVTSVFLCCQQAARRMIERKAGGIVNVGSVAGHTGGGGGTVPYAAAKSAVHTLTRGLARELAPHGVRVNGVSPGMVDTPMLAGRVSDQARQQISRLTPLGRFAEARELGPAIVFLLSSGASYITGEIIEVNGGLLMH